jgi:predicted PurR-regulated permease PerM
MPASLSSTKTRAALSTSARISLQILVILAMTGVTLWLLGRMWSVLWPLVVALLLTTLTWPLTRFLRRHGWHPRWPRRPWPWCRCWSRRASWS